MPSYTFGTSVNAAQYIEIPDPANPGQVIRPPAGVTILVKQAPDLTDLPPVTSGNYGYISAFTAPTPEVFVSADGGISWMGPIQGREALTAAISAGDVAASAQAAATAALSAVSSASALATTASAAAASAQSTATTAQATAATASSTATAANPAATAINAARGASSGIATLGSDGLLSAAQRPAGGGGGGGGGSVDVRAAGPYAAIIVKSGTNYVAYNMSTGSQIGSATNDIGALCAAIQTSLGAVGGLICYAGGAAGTVRTSVVLKPQFGLCSAGFGYDRHASALAGHFLVGTGLSTSQAVVSIGATGSAGVVEGASVFAIGIDGNGAHGIVTMNATDLQVRDAVVVDCNRGLWLQSTEAPDAGGVAMRLNNVTVRGCDAENLRVEGTGATDGAITDCRFLSSPTNVYIAAGGWLMTTSHVTGNSSTSCGMRLSGAANCVIVGNYFDAANAAGAFCVVVGGAKNIVNGNFFNNPGATVAGCVQVGDLRGTLIGNTYTTGGKPFAVSTFANSQIAAGNMRGNVIGNHGSTGPAFVDSTGANVPDGGGSSWRVLGNTNF